MLCLGLNIEVTVADLKVDHLGRVEVFPWSRHRLLELLKLEELAVRGET